MYAEPTQEELGAASLNIECTPMRTSVEAVRGCSKEYTVSDVTDIQFRLGVDIFIITYRDDRGAYKEIRARVTESLSRSEVCLRFSLHQKHQSPTTTALAIL